MLLDAGSAALTLAHDSARTSLHTTATPIDATTLRAALAPTPNALPALAHMVHLQLETRMDEHAPLSSAAVRFLLQAAAAFEGPATIIGQPGTLFPAGFLRHTLATHTGWPFPALYGVRQGPNGLATQGLTPLLGYEVALATTPSYPEPDPNLLHTTARWLVEAQPTLEDGTTIGSREDTHAHLRWGDARALLWITPHPTYRPSWGHERRHQHRAPRPTTPTASAPDFVVPNPTTGQP